MPTAKSAVAICAGCGVALDPSRHVCEARGTPHGSARVREHEQPSDGYWGGVRAMFTCSASERRRAREVAHVARTRRAERATQRRALIPLVATMVLGPIIGGVIYLTSSSRAKSIQLSARATSVETMKRFSFAMTPAEVGRLFGIAPAARTTVKLSQPAVFEKAEIRLAGPGAHPSLTLRGGARFDARRIADRIRELVGERLRAGPFTEEINVSKTLLRIDPRGTGDVQITTWVDGPRGVELADAFLAAVRYAALEGPRPSTAQLLLIKGVPLAEAAKLDASRSVETAAKQFAMVFPDGGCKTITDLVSRETMMTCTADVDDPWIETVQYSWPDIADAKLQRVAMRLAVAGDEPPEGLARCVSSLLGTGTPVVVDHATGATRIEWPIGKHGIAALDRWTFKVRDGARATDPAEWASRHRAILGAIVGCAPLGAVGARTARTATADQTASLRTD